MTDDIFTAALEEAARTDPTAITPPTHQPATASQSSLGEVRAANANVRATPVVRKLADNLGVRLSEVSGSGPAGMILQRDVRQKAELQRPPLAAGSFRPAAAIVRASLFDPHNKVSVDDYAINPAVDDIRQIFPDKYAAAIAAGDQPPTLFPSGSLPVFTASGISPTMLSALPWPVRIPAAQAGDQAAAADLLNNFTPGPNTDRAQLAADAHMFFGNHDGNQQYVSRVRSWLNDYVYAGGQWTKTPRYF